MSGGGTGKRLDVFLVTPGAEKKQTETITLESNKWNQVELDLASYTGLDLSKVTA